MSQRFARHSLLPGWQQEKLAHALVVVVGLGALGNAVTQALALAGVGHFVLCDPDTIEVSNLSRTPLFREHDVGLYKVDAAARALSELAPGVRVETRPRRVEHGVGLAELRDADLTLSCLDSRAARLELAGRCGLVAARWLDGATGPWSGEIRPYLSPDGPCYGCGQDPEARATNDTPWSCRIATDGPAIGAAAPLSAVVGAHMALAAVRVLMGLPVSQDLLVLDGVAGTVTPLRQRRDPKCPYHTRIQPAEPVPVAATQPVGELLHAIGPNCTPLTWSPFQLRVECGRCRFSEPRIGTLQPSACPRCGHPLRARTTLELDQAPPTPR
jgi:molybdopterin/thiamine biosynthesis adenylyltransferase